MKITKYSHACLVIEKSGTSLVVDPGNWSSDLVIPTNVTGIIVTHEHADHCDHDLLTYITGKNPAAVIYAHEDVTRTLSQYSTQSVETGESIQVGDFTLEFVGGNHAVIHETIPPIANLGVIIDDIFYYPGDSFTNPSRAVDLLALPVAAPWMKISEAMDFLAQVAPKQAFPTHDAILSDTGKALSDTLLSSVAKDVGTEYLRLQPGEALDT